MRQAEAARKAEIGAAISAIKAKMAAYGITLADLGGKARAAKGRKPKAANAAKAAKTSCIDLPHLKRRGLRLGLFNLRRRAEIEGAGRERV